MFKFYIPNNIEGIYINHGHITNISIVFNKLKKSDVPIFTTILDEDKTIQAEFYINRIALSIFRVNSDLLGRVNMALEMLYDFVENIEDQEIIDYYANRTKVSELREFNLSITEKRKILRFIYFALHENLYSNYDFFYIPGFTKVEYKVGDQGKEIGIYCKDYVSDIIPNEELINYLSGSNLAFKVYVNDSPVEDKDTKLKAITDFIYYVINNFPLPTGILNLDGREFNNSGGVVELYNPLGIYDLYNVTDLPAEFNNYFNFSNFGIEELYLDVKDADYALDTVRKLVYKYCIYPALGVENN